MTVPNLLAPRRRLVRRGPKVCMALCLGPREVGRAIVSTFHIPDKGVANIRKVRTQEGKEHRFRQVVERMLALWPVGGIALVNHSREQQDAVSRQCAIVHELAHTYQLEVTAMEPQKVREHFCKGLHARPTNRRLAAALCQRFPDDLREFNFNPLDGRAPQVRTPAERYWTPLFLAIGAAVIRNGASL